ncbi:MAG: 2-oxoglutarate dehydrogenase E1 component [Chromatiaceae bacterium]|nr:2-oxoglutarate dehydrogenase E1 component [Chromatiaceae bacterium]MCP5306687.1 2-oxoglutarate dehydrogenase E1 component [Chromatiaceae bacterium]MCP5421811.1 2-oxoglutarate dehydrogenase E1 component [Chromatiaceae bacterium]
MDRPLTARRRRSGFSGANAEYIDQLYEAFCESPDRVSPEWRSFFYGFEHGTDESSDENELRPPPGPSPLSGVERLFMAYRHLGHLYADIDPLGLMPRQRPKELDPGYYGLDDTALAQQVTVLSIDAGNPLAVGDAVVILERVYCGPVASEHMHITASDERRWIEQRLESTHGDWAAQNSPRMRIDTLRDLTAAEGLEQYLHRRYVGQKRFSLEGGDSLIPLLDEIVQGGGQRGITDIVIGMAHRGRLNVLVNLLGKAPSELFSEFEGRAAAGSTGSGDVKYHQGFYSNIQTDGGPVRLSLAFNPSHLEIIAPVVQGGCRARQDRHEEDATDLVLPVIVHGDAAFIGQGVVTETLNLSKTPAYGTGGTIHVVVNNQIGFTTSHPQEARSTLYCTEVAKLVQAPIFHVNADDPDAVLFVTRLALDYRLTFHSDVVIDLVCYRRQGHNEADEPMMTQPQMYRRIRELPTTRTRYAERLAAEQLITAGEAEAMRESYRASLEQGKVIVREFLHGSRTGYEAHWEQYLNARPDEYVETRVPLQKLTWLGQRALRLPDDFTLQRGVARVVEERHGMLTGKLPLDWGMAETLAYATLLHEGHAIRLSGQDSIRGTFAHRHAAYHEQDTFQIYTPLQHLYAGQPRFEVINSLLSELAVLGFEYGYATSMPNTLVIWEAQFGDFANGAQMVIDQFISSGYLKWGRLCQLTLFLPHGFEGQGPEHSSARLERFLQLCAELNMRVWVPTTPAQFFHLLRDQIKRRFRRPLIVMTPKSLLRHPLSKSGLDAFSDKGLATVLGEIDTLDTARVRRVVLCSGKVYFDLLATRRERGIDDIAILRVEQLYPFPRRRLAELLKPFDAAAEIVWCQEEPRNQGAWYQIQHHLRALTGAAQSLGYAGRSPSASPACGDAGLHRSQQQALVDAALALGSVEDPGERLEDTDAHYSGR